MVSDAPALWKIYLNTFHQFSLKGNQNTSAGNTSLLTMYVSNLLLFLSFFVLMVIVLQGVRTRDRDRIGKDEAQDRVKGKGL